MDGPAPGGPSLHPAGLGVGENEIQPARDGRPGNIRADGRESRGGSERQEVDPVRLHGQHLPQHHAEAIFRALVSDAGVPYGARSAGVAVLVGEPNAANARAVLDEAGVRAGRGRARQIDQAKLEEVDLVLAMTSEHVAALHRLAGRPSEKVRTLRGYAKDGPDADGIADPYGMPIYAYRASSREIFGYVDQRRANAGVVPQ